MIFLDFDRVLDLCDEIRQAIQDLHVLYRFNFEELSSVFAKIEKYFGILVCFLTWVEFKTRPLC